jgi:hypothetical protein
VCPRAGLDDVKKRKFLPLPDSNTDPSVVQPVTSRYTYYAIRAPQILEDSTLYLFSLFEGLLEGLRAHQRYPVGLHEMSYSSLINKTNVCIWVCMLTL